MNGQPAASARALARSFALAGGVFVLLVGASCGRETFDLLAPGPGAANGGAASLGAAGNGGADPGPAGGHAGTGAGGVGRAGEPAKAGAENGGNVPIGDGFAGDGQGGTDAPCFPGESCVDGGVSCPPTASVCRRCQGDNECGHDEPYCAIADGRCVECLPSKGNCRPGYSCDPTFLRCAKSCLSNPDCGDNHQVCAISRGVCVDCRFSSECQAVPGHESYTCIAGFCVECGEDINCPNPAKPACQQFHCVARP